MCEHLLRRASPPRDAVAHAKPRPTRVFSPTSVTMETATKTPALTAGSGGVPQPAVVHGAGQAPPLAGLDFPLSHLWAKDWADLLAAMSVQNLRPADVASLLDIFDNRLLGWMSSNCVVEDELSVLGHAVSNCVLCMWML